MERDDARQVPARSGAPSCRSRAAMLGIGWPSAESKTAWQRRTRLGRVQLLGYDALQPRPNRRVEDCHQLRGRLDAARLGDDDGVAGVDQLPEQRVTLGVGA